MDSIIYQNNNIKAEEKENLRGWGYISLYDPHVELNLSLDEALNRAGYYPDDELFISLKKQLLQKEYLEIGEYDELEGHKIVIRWIG